MVVVTGKVEVVVEILGAFETDCPVICWSGAIAITRKADCITRENTGAATVPP